MIKNPASAASFSFQLDLRSGVPVYRRVMERVLGSIAAGRLADGDQLPTVRQLAVDLQINPNTVIRAYRELEIRGFLDTQQGSGTFITPQRVTQDDEERRRKLDMIVRGCGGGGRTGGFNGKQGLGPLGGRKG